MIPSVLVLVGVAGGAGLLGALTALAQVRASAGVRGISPPPAWPTALVGGLVAAALGGRFGADWLVPALAVLAGCAAALSAVDLRFKRLPDAMMAPTYLLVAPLVAAAALAGGEGGRLPRALVAATVVGLAFVALKLARPAGIGLGDVKLAPLLGLVLGWFGWQEVLVGIFLSYLGAAAVVLAGLLTRRTSLRDDVPFGPYLLAGTLVTVALVGG